MWIISLKDHEQQDVSNLLLKYQLSMHLRSDKISNENINSHSDLVIPLAQHKGKRSCILHPLHNYSSYGYITMQYHGFISTVNSFLISQVCFRCHVKFKLADIFGRRDAPFRAKQDMEN